MGQQSGTVVARSLTLCPQLRGGTGVQAEMDGRLWASPPQLLCVVGEAGRLAAEIQTAAYLKGPEALYCVSAARPTEEAGAASPGSVGL